MYQFDVAGATAACVEWIRAWFEKNGKGCNAVIGISGGKDSTVVAGLCVAALGKERVIGVMMPQDQQADIADSQAVCRHLGIRAHTVNVGPAISAIAAEIERALPLSTQSRVNLPPRVRMATLYAVAQSENGRVANTCNLSEDWVGYSTRYGDSVGDFSPISHFTVAEVMEIGCYLGLPAHLVRKTPSDGLCGKTDEDNLGFTYAMLDAYIREGVQPPAPIQARIDRLHEMNLFKLRVMDSFEYQA